MAEILAHFEGTLGARDCKRNIALAFTTPRDCGRMHIVFEFSPYQIDTYHNMITLTLFDPHGFRGAGHRGGARHEVTLEAGSATPGYFAGPLPSGEWVVELDTHMILPGQPVTYWLEVSVAEAGGPSAAQAVTTVRDAEPVRGPGWFRGDLHTHTQHSDAAGFSVADLVATARAVGLDFVFLTDHNTTSGMQALDGLAVPSTMLVAGGIELTTYWGHALCLGGREWVDWRVRPCTREMSHVAAESYARGRLFIIAHPASDGDPGCTGCAWRFGDMMPDNARAVEVWNGPWVCDSNNEAALALWYDWLNQGLQLVATAGTDYHGEPFEEGASGTTQGGATMPDAWANVGFNMVHAEALTEEALLEAIGAGHLYLSAGPQLSFEARDAGEGVWRVGDTISGAVHDPLDFTLLWEACPPEAQVRLVANGRPFGVLPANGAGEHRWQMRRAEADWIVVEIRDSQGRMLAVTNPIFLWEAPTVGGAAC
ncbi:MAG: CehA/McbA family metallohydrolase [Anaerolineae bacterium]|nr:CehA/McbA family metallohydrolase [Anaerolineae bacterium]